VRNPIAGAQFRRDVKLAQKRNKDMTKLREAILLLIEGNSLPQRYKDHPLGGGWKHFRDCHIEPDWLLNRDRNTIPLLPGQPDYKHLPI